MTTLKKRADRVADAILSNKVNREELSSILISFVRAEIDIDRHEKKLGKLIAETLKDFLDKKGWSK